MYKSKIAFLITLFILILCSFHCVAQTIPIKELFDVKNYKDAGVILIKNEFAYVSIDSSDEDIDYTYSKRISPSDSIVFKYSYNNSTSIVTLVYFFENVGVYKGLKNDLKKWEFKLEQRLGGKYNGYIEEYKNPEGKKIRILMNYKEDLKTFKYSIYFL